MTGLEIGLFTVVLIFILILLGMPVPITFLGVSFVGIWLLRGNMPLATKMLALAATDSISDYLFVVIPLFVLMGMLVMEAGMGRDSYTVSNQVFRRVPGGLGLTTVGGNAIFAAITGISVASVAVFTKLAVPEMLRYGYSPRFAVGVVAGSSVLGMLIPPSLLFIIFGILTETSIRGLFLGGVVPGILLAVAFCLMIVVWAIMQPTSFGRGAAQTAPEENLSLTSILSMILPIILLIGAVLGGLYGGLFTAAEGGAVGAAAALAIAMAKRSLTLKSFWRLLLNAGSITTSLLLLIIGANLYSRVLVLTGLPAQFGGWFSTMDAPLLGIVAVYLLVLLVLGFVMDATSILFIVVPIVLPVFRELGVDMVWLGVLSVLAVEIGLLTPPFGISAFVVKVSLNNDDISIADVFLGAAPFALVMLLVLAIIAYFPWFATVFG